MLTTSQLRAARDAQGAKVSPEVTPAAANNLLTYRGGPVLANVNVVTVFWGNNVQFSGSGSQSLNSFYSAVVKSPYYDWLKEYNTPSQSIGEGSFNTSFNYTNGKTGNITDSAIESGLSSLIDSGKVPAPTTNTYYAIHFAPGINITMSDGSQSCQVFCAYHNSYSHGGKNVYYGVIPDQGGSCAGGCGSNASLFNNTTSVSSHELVEATTDADVGNNNLAWYNDSQGEIGDICNAQQGSVAGYTVQKEWSNQSGACIVSKGGGGGGGSGGSGGGGGGGSGGSGGGGGGGCAHAICSTGTRLTKSCDPCVTQICGQDSYCCSTAWDSICVGEVGSICGKSCN